MNEFSKLGLGVLVTGDGGFVGQHVLANWPEAMGLSVLCPGVDVRDKSALVTVLRRWQPQAVLHLAGLSFVPDSFKAPETTFEVNFLGTLRLLEALAETGFVGRFIFVGSGDAYGLVPEDGLPVWEERALRPRNPYAVSKAAAEALCFQWSQTGPFEVMMARPFNHIGPGQAASFVIADFARQIAEVVAGRRAPEMHVGNIDVARDFTDVADVVRAYALMLAHGKNGEAYNICSGVERTVRSLLERLLDLTRVQVKVVTDVARFRPAEQQHIHGSFDKLRLHTGWRPLVSMDDTLVKIFHYWEQEIGK